MATLAIMIPYAATALASIAFQRRERRMAVGEMSAAGASLITCGWIAASSGWRVIGWTSLLLALGLPVYAWMRRRVGAAAMSASTP